MNTVLWIVAGGLVGLTAYAALNLNLRRGVISSVTIGMAAGFAGGYSLAPVFGSTGGQPHDLSAIALLVAVVTALGCLSITDMMAKRFGY